MSPIPRRLSVLFLLLLPLLVSCMGAVKVRRMRTFAELDYGPGERYLEVKGVKFCYVEQGKGRPIVLLHPWFGSLRYWKMMLPRLSRYGRVIAIDLPGHGKSTKVLPSYAMPGLTRAIAALLDRLRVRNGTVIGNSLGGNLALRLAIARPDLINQVVALAPAGVGSRPRFARLAGLSFARLALGWSSPPIARAAFNFVAIHKPSPRTDQYVSDMLSLRRARGYRHHVAAIVGIGRAIASSGAVLDTPLRSLEARTLFVWGAQDRLVPVAPARKIVATMPKARLVILPQCGHIPEIECPGPLLRVVEPFLKGG